MSGWFEIAKNAFRRDRLSLGKEETQQHWIETFHRNPEG